jgi:phage terminase large subunit
MSSGDWELPAKLAFLFEPHRYKVARGGRGSAKSWSFARGLLIRGYQAQRRILCTREVQHTIKQSVHQLLTDQIIALGLEKHYEVLNNEIRGDNGTNFQFAGLSDLTADNVKSYEGVDIVWVEEGQTTSPRSWKILIPTIRKDGSEIWVTYNPELESDETHQRFVVNPPPDCVSVLMNWSDNKWFPPVLERERLHAKATLPKAEYDNIWEGKCLPAVAGAIYFDEMAAAEESGRIGRFPMDPKLKVHRIWDMGWNDAMAVILAQRHGSALTVVGYVTGTRRTTADYVAEFKNEPKYKGWNWGSDFLPHDGFAKNRQTGKGDDDVLKGLGCTVKQTPNIDVEQGIRQARMLFPRVYIDREATQSDKDSDLPGLVECLKRYRRRISAETGTAGSPLHDVHSNGADAFRYLALNAEEMTNDADHADWNKPIKVSTKGIV